eukprot:scpid45789/ scgid11968/ Uncharacterized protein K02A2.6
MSSAKFPLPDSFDFSSPQSWPQWTKRFERFRSLSKLDQDDETRQISTLLYTMGAEADNIFDALPLTDDTRKKYDSVTAALDKYFTPAVNVIHQRTIFEQTTQHPGESVEEFVRRLRAAAKYCAFDKPDERIRDRFVAHMTDRAVSKQLQLKDHTSLTLADAIASARKTESVNKELALQAPMNLAAAAYTPRQPQDWRPPVKQGPSKPSPSSQARYSRDSTVHKCRWCGLSTDHKSDRARCPAQSQKCRTCGKLGHFATVCRSATSTAAHTVDLLDANDVDTIFMGAATEQSHSESAASSSSQPRSEPWMITLDMCGTSTPFKIDTGADLSIMTLDSYQALPSPPALDPCVSRLLGPDGTTLPVQGQFTTTAKLQDASYDMAIVVIASGPVNLLSRDQSSRMGLIQRPQACSTEVRPTTGCMLGDPVEIVLKDDAKPYNCVTARRIPIPIRGHVRSELERMEAAGVIERVEKPTDRCAPVVSVIKPNGSVRVCVDLKKPPEPLQPTDFPSLPWERVGVDILTHNGTERLVVVDHFSRYLHAPVLRSTTTSAVIKALSAVFAIHGVPQTVVSDNGPQFASAEFEAFAAKSKFTHRTSSPRFSQSNGEAERAVRTVKRLLESNQHPDEALLAYRSTPLANGFSPAELLFGRRLRTNLPVSDTALTPSWPDLPALQQWEAKSKEQQCATFNAARRTQELPVLQQGTSVWVSDLKAEAVVADRLSDRSYSVVTADLSRYRRNRRHLAMLPSAMPRQTPQPEERVPEPRMVEVERDNQGPTEPQPTLRRSSRVSQPTVRLDL